MKRILLFLFIFLMFSSYAQEIKTYKTPLDSLDVKEKSWWELTAVADIKTINFYSDEPLEGVTGFNSDISTMRIGATYITPKLQSELSVGVGSFSASLKKYWPSGFFTHVGIKNVRMNNSYYRNYSSVHWYDAKTHNLEYRIGAGFLKTFRNKIQLEFQSVLSRIHFYNSEEVLIRGNQGYENKILLANYSFELSPSFQYGGNVKVILPSHEFYYIHKNFSFFFGFEYLYHFDVNFNRKVIIEEWIPGNFVYKEETEENKYKIENYSFVIGFNWKLKRQRKIKL